MPHMLGLFCEQNMTIQTANLGTPPSGVGGDTFRTAATKFNENFTNNMHAASRLVGSQAGNVMEVGAFGLRKYLEDGYDWGFSTGVTAGGVNLALTLLKSETEGSTLILPTINAYDPIFRSRKSTNQAEWSDFYAFYTTKNTIKDSNGFLKGASPVVKLFADKIELNEEALEQEPVFEKVDVGHYLLKNTEGFSDDGWYIEMPKDANGNVLIAVIYEQLENNDISVKTYAKKFDEETGDIVANTAKPRDIPAARWIDLRLQELPQDDAQPISTDETVATNAE